jgi:hypothetical protein
VLSSVFLTKLKFDFPYSHEEAKRLLNIMNGIADQVLAPVAGRSDYEKAVHIHDYLVKNATYSTEINGRSEAHSIVGALIHRKCVCEGYARAYKFLCDKAKIPCIIAVGTAWGSDGVPENHAWNVIRIGNTCYHVDVTFDQYYDNKYCSRAFMFLSTREILETHTIDKEFELPDCPKNATPLETVNTMNELFAAMKRDCRKNITHTEYLLSGFVEASVFMREFDKRKHNLDVATHSKVNGLFCADSKMIRVIGVSWR